MFGHPVICIAFILNIKLYVNLNFSLQLVAHAQSLQVDLSSEAEKLIHGYFMASRRVRTQSHGVKMSVASVKLL